MLFVLSRFQPSICFRIPPPLSGGSMRKQLEGRNLAFSVYTNVHVVSNMDLIAVEWLMKCHSVVLCVVDNRDDEVS